MAGAENNPARTGGNIARDGKYGSLRSPSACSEVTGQAPGGSPNTPAYSPLAFGLAAIVVCLGFAAITGHIWEDYFITFRASLNLATGRGLVFQPGERVHSFTSPLGTLLPALFALGGGGDVALRALWGLRLVSALAFGCTLWGALRSFRRDNLIPIAAIATATAWLLDPKTVDFAINGMETAFVVFFATFTWQAFTSGARLWPCALACAGLQWTRPDGWVYFAAIAGAWLLLGAPREGLSWRTRSRTVLRPIAVGIVFYLPWLIVAWSYYGSPVPHTILAKAGHDSLTEIAKLLCLYPWRLLFGHVALHEAFLPAYHSLGGWPQWLHVASRLLVIGAALAWIWPRVPTAGRIASAAFFIGGFYVACIPQAPWYFPGWQAIALISWAYLLHALWQVRPRTHWAANLPHSTVRIGATLIVLLQAGLFACVTWQMRAQQEAIENGHRREIGIWLRQNAAANDTVFLECLGYIGYYSGLKMLDHPGLAAPEVVAARRAGHQRWADLIEVLQPKWLVLRPIDAGKVFDDRPGLGERYQLVRTFDATAAVNKVPLLPGHGYVMFDAVFLVYRQIPGRVLPP